MEIDKGPYEFVNQKGECLRITPGDKAMINLPFGYELADKKRMDFLEYAYHKGTDWDSLMKHMNGGMTTWRECIDKAMEETNASKA